MKQLFLLFLLLVYVLHVKAQEMVEFDYELDAYYSNVSAFIDLDKNNEIKDGTDLSEFDIYSQLFFNAYKPNIFLVEASVNPMPVLGLYVRKHHEELYDKSNVQDFNLVKAMTAGFEEPYSLAFFVGRMMVFSKEKKDGHIGKNRAYIGVLFDMSNKTIKDNRAYRDNWYEFELKLKGTREIQESDLDWSFRVGGRVHSNEYFVDSLYFGARRSSIDYTKSTYSLRYNTSYDVLAEFDRMSMKPLKFQVVVGKKFPLSSVDKISLGIDIGYLYNSGNRYRGELKDEGVDKHQLIFRPNLKF